MHTTYKCLFILAIISCSCLGNVNAQLIPKTLYHDGSREQHEVQKLIDHSIGMAERMLEKQGAYTPYAAALTVSDSIVIIEGYSDTKEKTLIRALADLKAMLKAGADKGMYKAVVVFFDVTVTDPETNLPTDAIAAYTEQMNTNGCYTFYFPYKKTELKGFVHSRSIPGEISDSEIFTKVAKN